MQRDQAEPLTLEARHLSKKFGDTLVLDDVNLDIQPAEVHGLLGENGSGKSTFIKILAGYHAPEPGGSLRVNGADIRLPLRPGQFQDLGMAFVHQDLALVPSLTVLENLRIGELARSRGRWHISWGKERQRAAEAFSRFNVDLDPREKVANLSQVQRALLAIVRAVEAMHYRRDTLGTQPGLLVLDEPTVFLPREGKDQLFNLVRDIAAHGHSVLFVSHNLDEVMGLTNRVTVLRDGRLQGTVDSRTVSERQLINMIIGRHLDEMKVTRRETSHREPVLRSSGMSGGTLRNVSLELFPGEVLGLTGLMGSGFEEVPYVLVGAIPADNGTLDVEGEALELAAISPSTALRLGIALVPANRQRDGSVGSLTVCDNVMLQVLDQYFRGFWLQRGRIQQKASDLLDQFDVRPRNPSLDYRSLSGGNQQKALMAKWLQIDPPVLILHEPTQGVDVGARQQIYEMIRQVAQDGKSVICASTDFEQLEAICDRVLIFARGTAMQELIGDEITKDRLTEQCFNSAAMAEA